MLIMPLLFITLMRGADFQDCASVRTGTFYFYPRNSMRSYRIERSAAQQTDVNLNTGDTLLSSIQWTDSCTYTLTFISGTAVRPLFKGKTSTFKIDYVTPDYYTVRMIDAVTLGLGARDTVWHTEHMQDWRIRK